MEIKDETASKDYLVIHMSCRSINHKEDEIKMILGELKPDQGPAVLSLALGTVFGTVLTKIPISVRYLCSYKKKCPGIKFKLEFRSISITILVRSNRSMLHCNKKHAVVL